MISKVFPNQAYSVIPWHWWCLLPVIPSRAWTGPAPPAFPHKRDAPVPQSALLSWEMGAGGEWPAVSHWPCPWPHAPVASPAWCLLSARQAPLLWEFLRSILCSTCIKIYQLREEQIISPVTSYILRSLEKRRMAHGTQVQPTIWWNRTLGEGICGCVLLSPFPEKSKISLETKKDPFPLVIQGLKRTFFFHF